MIRRVAELTSRSQFADLYPPEILDQQNSTASGSSSLKDERSNASPTSDATAISRISRGVRGERRPVAQGLALRLLVGAALALGAAASIMRRKPSSSLNHRCNVRRLIHGLRPRP